MAKNKKTRKEESGQRRGKNARQDEIRGETSEVPQNGYGYKYEE